MLGLPIAAETIPAAVLTADAGSAADAGPIVDFSNVLQQLMGPAPGAGSAVDLPLAGDEGDGGEDADRAAVDELVNAIVVDLGAPPTLRLAATTVWAVADAPLKTVDEVSAPAGTVMTEGLEGPATSGLAAAEPVSPPVTQAAFAPFETMPMLEGQAPAGVPAAAAAGALESGEVVAPAAPATPQAAPQSAPQSAAPAAPQSPAPAAPQTAAGDNPAVGAERAIAPTPQAQVPRADVPRPDSPRAEALSPAESAPSAAPATPGGPAGVASPAPAREFAEASVPSSRQGHKHEAARQLTRVTADAGQRAYAAAAAEAPARDRQQGFSDARPEPGADLQSAGAPPDRPAAVPFHVIAERPAPAAAAALAAPVLLAGETVDAAAAAELPAQVVQSIRMQAIDGGGEAIVRLRPDYLGELVVAVKVENGAVTAALQSDTPAVRKWVESNEATLRQALAEQGLQLDRLTVSDEAPSADSGEREGKERQEREPQSESQPRRQRKPAPDATFEVIV